MVLEDVTELYISQILLPLALCCCT
jgi:hypothetical protein